MSNLEEELALKDKEIIKAAVELVIAEARRLVQKITLGVSKDIPPAVRAVCEAIELCEECISKL